MTHINNSIKTNRKIKQIFIILSFIVISIISSILLIHSHILLNISDAQFHFKRISELSEDIKHCNFFPLFGFNQFNGSSVMTLYPYFNLFPISILFIIFKSKVILFYIYFIFETLIGLIISFYSSLRFSRNDKTSYLFSIIYMISNVFLGYNFNIVDLGSSSAFIFLPLVIFGFLDILNHSNNYIKLSSGIILIMFSHIPDTIIIWAFLLVWLLVNLKKINHHIIILFGKSILLIGLVTSMLWIPIIKLLYMNKGNLHFSNPIIPNGIDLSEFISNAFKINNFSNDVDVNGLGFFATLTIFISIIFYKHFSLYIKQMYWLSLIIILMCSSIIKWPNMPLFIAKLISHFQTTYRFLIIPIILLSYIFSQIITKYLSIRINVNVLCALMILLAIIFQLVGQNYFVHNFTTGSQYRIKRNDDLLYCRMKTSKQINAVINKRPNGPNGKGVVTNKSTGSDYYPISSFSKLNNINNNQGLYGHNQVINIKHTGYNQFSFNNRKGIHQLTLPILHYNGEHLLIYLNHHLKCYHSNKDNLITLNNVNSGKNEISVKYVPNMLLVVLKSVAFLSGIIWIIVSLIRNQSKLGNIEVN